MANQALFGYTEVPPTAPPLVQATLVGTQGAQLVRQVSARTPQQSVEQIRAGLVELGVPCGLAQMLADEDSKIGLRMYLLDNSGSTAASDGNLVEAGPGGTYSFRGATRWDEICALAMDHAKWNLVTGIPCEFMLLNCTARDQQSPMTEGRDFVHIDRSTGVSDGDQIAGLKRMLDANGPRGVTPITARVQEIHQRIKQEFQDLTRQGQFVFLNLCTDGMPTSPMSGQSSPKDQADMCEALRHLCTDLPVQLVIRLCTDDDATVAYYNKVDEDMELPLDILDDMRGEAKEIAAAGNGWFSYTPLLHRIREAGTMCKLLDLLDERQLNPVEVKKLVQLLCDSPKPLPNDNAQFVKELRDVIGKSRQVFDARAGRMQNFVDLNGVKRALGVGGCSVM
eukprot:CAMPEP_0204338436 /NCGR_PEP_ID=MMETSP0469-20131031/21052_1 /ASSEMBLY_ACC=CAM_ASM_000384 /TAXON_ID=2969 /ORGANISM="Oxyrrhis marina" /LENGTH=394 /DNA_ID=CAMNT_0051322615 /DNA_START=19 /DNA_END=1203 /DNA_ORIENTATION=-